MSRSQREKIQALLAAETSALREELLALAFEAVTAAPVRAVVDRAALYEHVYRALAQESLVSVARARVLGSIARLSGAVRGRSERVRDLLSDDAEARLMALVASGKGPRFVWLKGALDPADVRQLIGPVIQQLLLQFTQKLPIPGIGGGASGGAASGLSGLVGRIGKQVQRSAGQLADVGRSVLGGTIRDFSQTATSEFGTALKERLASTEGQEIVARMRDRVVKHVLGSELDAIVADLLRLPDAEIADLVALALAHNREQSLFRSLLEQELGVVLDGLEARSLEEQLKELGLFEATRSLVLSSAEPPLKALFRSEVFGGWLGRLLAEAEASVSAPCERLLVATSNPHKVREMADVLAPLGFDVVGLDQVAADIPEPVEDADTFEGNARIKAVAYARALAMACVAEDSGLEVGALGGAPGVYSARYAGIGTTREEKDRANNEKLLAALDGVSERRARFVCALCLVDAHGEVRFETRGTYEGVIAEAPRGENGFGYDPLLLLPDVGKTSAELAPEEKAARSHRGAATRALAAFLRAQESEA